MKIKNQWYNVSYLNATLAHLLLKMDSFGRLLHFDN